jgi:branched-chain amino acid transport system ATP-binding protein
MLLEARGLTKRFGGLMATDHLDLTVDEFEMHAVIGPNGAGKSTLVGQLTGAVTSDSGRVLLGERDITGLSVHQRVALGLARSYQVTNIFRRLTALENVALAVQTRHGSSFRFWRPVAKEAALFDTAHAMLARVGLAQRAGIDAGTLSHGEQRQLEVALALATEPRVLLLDEPMAGIGPDESERMVRLLASLKGTLTVVLVEHDMDAVFRLADRISVLVYGRVIATGLPAEIRANAEVHDAYLGTQSA